MKERLLQSADSRITRDGVLILKAQQHRTRELNRQDVYERLRAILEAAAIEPVLRKATRPTFGSRVRRREDKVGRSGIKRARSNRGDE